MKKNKNKTVMVIEVLRRFVVSNKSALQHVNTELYAKNYISIYCVPNKDEIHDK